VAARIAVALLAVAALAWLGLMERGVRLQDQAIATASSGDIAGAQAQLRHSRLLNPDAEPDRTRALLYVGVHRRRAALDVLESIVRREPDNIAAWGDLLRFGRGVDPAIVRRATAAIGRLDPVATQIERRGAAGG
jgi:hypothetical protein